ncbi:cyclic 2,3-diphosphoglycerate synthase [Candidatus Woesearchaeota archaeon]|nr:cyclic 2,3-diphosphoglycerate synthase [Candidatus Woesearchaeota archaeon]
MKKVIIMGAAGRDFHDFNTVFKDNKDCQVVAFTAEQIPNISGRKYPAKLAGKAYPKGIPIFPEKDLAKLIKKHKVDFVTLSYSDLYDIDVMNKAAITLAAGADFMFISPKNTMLKSKVPVIAVCAVRTGAGKSPVSRKIAQLLSKKKYRVVVVRHPMPYGDLAKQAVQRFASLEDLDRYKCTIEEREDYEPHIKNGFIVYSGVNYQDILLHAQQEADVIIWDGGNNDTPFFKPDLHIVVVDPHRPGHEISYYPGETNFRMADVILINKMDSATKQGIATVKENIKKYNPKAKVIEAVSDLVIDNPERLEGKKVLVVEDGPTLTHGGMKYGAGMIIAQKYNTDRIDPRQYAVGSIKDIYKKYPHLGNILPAMGYGNKQVKELEKTINNAKCDFVISATPTDLSRYIKTKKEMIHVGYETREISRLKLADVIARVKIKKNKKK